MDIKRRGGYSQAASALDATARRRQWTLETANRPDRKVTPDQSLDGQADTDGLDPGKSLVDLTGLAGQA
jgi:hypothetical protein